MENQGITVAFVFSTANKVFKAIFLPLAVVFFVLQTLPAALMNTYFKGSFLFMVLGMCCSYIAAAFLVLYTKACFEGAQINLTAVFKDIKNWILPALSAALIFFGAMMAVGLVVSIVIMIAAVIMAAAASGGVTAPGGPNPALAFIAFATLLPFMYFIVRLSFFFTAIVVERKYWFEPYKKSWQLTRGHFWKVTLLILIAMLPTPIAFVAQSMASPLMASILLLLVMPFTFYFATLFNTLFFQLYYTTK